MTKKGVKIQWGVCGYVGVLETPYVYYYCIFESVLMKPYFLPFCSNSHLSEVLNEKILETLYKRAKYSRIEMPTYERWWRDFLCGWGAGVVETSVIFPIYKTVYRQQLHGLPIRAAYKQVSHVYMQLFEN